MKRYKEIEQLFSQETLDSLSEATSEFLRKQVDDIVEREDIIYVGGPVLFTIMSAFCSEIDVVLKRLIGPLAEEDLRVCRNIMMEVSNDAFSQGE